MKTSTKRNIRRAAGLGVGLAALRFSPRAAMVQRFGKAAMSAAKAERGPVKAASEYVRERRDLFETARKLYPHVDAIHPKRGGSGITTAATEATGPFFEPPSIGRIADWFGKKKGPAAKSAFMDTVKKTMPGVTGKPGVRIFPDSPPSVVAHELGHASSFTKGSNRRQNLKYGGTLLSIRSFRSQAPEIGALAAQPAISHSGMSEKNKRRARVLSLAPAIGLKAPLLVEEGRASVRGMKILKSAGYSPEYRRTAAKGLMKAWGTYGSMGLTPMATTGAAITAGYAGSGRRRRR